MVQELATRIPAAFEGEQVGYLSSISLEYCALVLDNMVAVASNATSLLDVEKKVFKCSIILPNKIEEKTVESRSIDEKNVKNTRMC